MEAVFLTHTHRDHIACLDDLKSKLECSKVYVHQCELLDDGEPIVEGFSILWAHSLLQQSTRMDILLEVRPI